MKKIIKSVIIVCSFVITITVCFAFDNSKAIIVQNTCKDCQYGQCSKWIEYSDGTTRQCKNCCQESSSYCWSHNHQ